MSKKKEDFKKMNMDQLKKRLAEMREDIRVIHFKAEGSKSKNVKEAKTIRRQVAQILTEINNIEVKDNK